MATHGVEAENHPVSGAVSRDSGGRRAHSPDRGSVLLILIC
jgi:hypothetical protein